MGNGSPVLSSRSLLEEADSDKCLPMSPNEFRSFKITKISNLTANTKSFLVNLPSQKKEPAMAPAFYVLINGPNDSRGKVFAGFSSNDGQQYIEMIVKANTAGCLSMYLHSLKTGDRIEIKGPLANLPQNVESKTQIGMITNGIDIEPMFLVLKKLLKLPSAQQPSIQILCSNKTEQDLLVIHPILHTLSIKHRNIQVTYVLTTPSRDWEGFSGSVTLQHLNATMPLPSDESLVYVYGDKEFLRLICGDKTLDKKQGTLRGLLKEAGFSEENVFKL